MKPARSHDPNKAPTKASTKAPTQADLADATISEFDGVRYLHLGTPWVQGAMRIRQPRLLELAYIQRMMAWLLWWPTDALGQGRAVQLGLGAAAITRFTHQTLRWPTTAVELNPSVINACRMWFHLPPDDERLQVLQADAGQWVHQADNADSVDVLFVDLYDHEAAAPVLDDATFYAGCRSVLAPGGLMSVNLFGRHASFARSAGHIAEAFGADQVWQLVPTKEGNTVVIAGRGVSVPDRDTVVQRAALIESRFGLPAAKWLRMVKPYRSAG